MCPPEPTAEKIPQALARRLNTQGKRFPHVFHRKALAHVTQRAETDCGIAVCAMLAGVTYRAAWQVLGHSLLRRGGLSAFELAQAVSQLTGRVWHSYTVEPAYQLGASPLCHTPTAVLLTPTRRSHGVGHWIVTTPEAIGDPTAQTWHEPERYMRVNEFVRRMVVPAEAALPGRGA